MSSFAWCYIPASGLSEGQIANSKHHSASQDSTSHAERFAIDKHLPQQLLGRSSYTACKLGCHWMCIQRELLYRFQREAEAARRDAAAFAEDKQRMEQELAYMRVLTHTSVDM